jgi:thiol-disulfide isomerase/thioredoxin
MLEKLKKVRPFWWFVAFFIAMNILWIGPSFFGARTLRRGVEAPAFSLPEVRDASRRIALEQLRGRTVLMVFWATWCDACLSELPVIEEIAARYRDRGLVVVGMNVEPGNRAGVQRFLEGRSISYPNVIVDSPTSEAYRVSLLPAIYVVDREGLVCRGFAGRTGKFRLSRAVEKCIGPAAD